MRLIDADALAEELWNIRWDLQMMDDTQTADKMMAGLRKAEIKLENAPTIDPVKHGRWIKDELITGTCSVCGWDAIFAETDVVGMSYCPNCGAKMDGVER